MPGETPVGAIVSVAYGLSDIKTFEIESGGDGTDSDPVIFDRHYSFFEIWCEGTSGIAPSTQMSLNVAYSDTMQPIPLMQQNQPGTPWVSTDNLPTSGGLAFQLTEAIGAKKLQIILSDPAVDAVTFHVLGIKQAAS